VSLQLLVLLFLFNRKLYGIRGSFSLDVLNFLPLNETRKDSALSGAISNIYIHMKI
jgi:hypothetical protein